MAIHHPLNHRNRSIHPKPIDLYRFSSTFKTPVGCDRDGRAGRFLSPCRASIHKALENPQKSLRSRETPSSSPCLSDFSPPQEVCTLGALLLSIVLVFCNCAAERLCKNPSFGNAFGYHSHFCPHKLFYVVYSSHCYGMVLFSGYLKEAFSAVVCSSLVYS